ncbi:MAG: hypothetical protein KGL38_02235 [Gemmatimonadota bacterium]|nr:hypothetical protein [Gemmatimonadota bacterium]MDE3126792.1 hypothetical protein [Gemmatimonadota bacterium]
MISIREIVRGALTRVAPAVAAFMGAVFLTRFIEYPGSGYAWALVPLATEALAAAVGYAAVLTAFRPRLHPSANVAGRRGLLVGLYTPLGILIASFFTEGVGLARVATVTAAVSGLITLGLFFPWLTPEPGGRLRGDDAAAAEALPDGAAIDSVPSGSRARERAGS